MKSDSFHFQHADGGVHHVHRWLPDAPPRGVLQIVHGMAEHGGRYGELAAALCEDGWAVYAQDLPGHGRTVALGGVRGHLADRDGWAATLALIAALREHLRNTHPGLPLCLFGHSMGSFLAQYLIRDPAASLNAAVLSATTIDMGPLRALGSASMQLQVWLRGPRAVSALGERLSFHQFNKAFAPNRTGFDWLSRDAHEVDAYVADPDCGHRCTVALWRDLLRAGADLSDGEALTRIPSALPVLLIAGSADPVSQGVEGPRALAAALRRAGLRRVDERYWDGARHELLHETCRDEVIAFLRGWLGNLLARRGS